MLVQAHSRAHQVLAALAETPDTTRRLAPRLGIPDGSTSSTCHSLGRRGLAVSKDGLWSLTEAGWVALAGLPAYAPELQRARNERMAASMAGKATGPTARRRKSKPAPAAPELPAPTPPRPKATRSPAPAAVPAVPATVEPAPRSTTAPRPASIRLHVLQDRRDQLVSELELARLRVLEVEAQLAAIVGELARVSA